MSRFALIAGLALALAVVPAASSGVHSSNVAKGVPSGLHAFLLRADDPMTHEFPRTPSFAWNPAPERGGHYQFELATSRSFQDSSIVFRDTRVAIPAETVPRQLPWMVGEPYALWVHVRWVSDNGMDATLWSKPFGFNMKWADKQVPAQETAPVGLVRWKPIEGATEYQVLYPDVPDTFLTTTNVADEREFFTFHPSAGYTPIHWRVRAVRDVSGKFGPSNGLPVVSYGPWSKVFTTVNPPQTAGNATATDTVSDYWGKTKAGHRFGLTPGFAWTPSPPGGLGAAAGSLYRVYVFSDNHCVNPVFKGSIVGSPAFAPRVIGGPIALPSDTKQLGDDESGPYPGPGAEGNALDAIGDPVTATEAGSGSPSSASGTGSTSPSTAKAAAPAAVDLWDTGWPTGRFYWTVVPVNIVALKTSSSSSSSSTGSSTTGGSSGSGASGGTAQPTIPIGYKDGAIPQDQCEGGNVMAFGKIARPVVTVAGHPFLSGVAPTGRTVAAAGKRAVVYESPIAAWQPATGATTYQIQMSRTSYPWHVAKTVSTPATSLVLPLSKTDRGTWYYRVRGIDTTLPAGAQAMSWSPVVRVTITGDRFTIVK